MSEHFGATYAQWEHFSKTLGLTADLLPVVSKPTAKISAQSTMKQLGKTPSRYNGSGEVVGIAKWTEHHATAGEIKQWSGKPDYGIALQTRTVRAFDIDCEDAVVGREIIAAIGHALPTRFRNNSNKCLLVFTLHGELPKRVIRMKEGIIELLGSGQQFIACGTHPSGAKYEWMEPMTGILEMPEAIPALTLEEVDHIWSTLEAKFAVAPSTSAAAPSKAKVLHAAIENDPVARHLIDVGAVLSTDRDGKMHITCPFEDGHSTASAISSTTYFPANTGGYQFGHFDCKHASCEHRVDQDFKDALEVPYEDPLGDFKDLTLPLNPEEGTTPDNTQAPEIKEAKLESGKKPRFTVVPAHEFAQTKSLPWIVKGVLPRADIGVVYGESTAGKSFWVLDLVGAIARGAEWRGHRVTQGNVAYICAEGAGGMRGRLVAYSDYYGTPLSDLPIGIIADAPNFMEVSEIKDVLSAVKTFGPVSVIVVDTFAQVMAGANENSGEDVGKALKHCKALSKHTGALVLLIHHAGKDTSKGARGWSGLRAAADVEIEIVRDGDERVATVTKMKDGSDGEQFGFKLNVVTIGIDEDGDTVSSCTVGSSEVSNKVQGKDTQAMHALVKTTLGDMIGMSKDTKVMYAQLVTAVADGMKQGTSKNDRRSEVAGSAIHKLITDKVLVDVGGFVAFATNDEGLV